MAEEKDNLPAAADDAANQIQRQREDAAKSAPPELDDIFDSNTDDRDNQQQPDHDLPKDKTPGATPEEQEAAEAENVARDAAQKPGEYDDGLGKDTNGYHPDQSPETAEREAMRDSIRGDDLDEGEKAPSGSKPEEKKPGASKEEGLDEEKAVGQSAAKTATGDFAAEQGADVAAEVAADVTTDATLDTVAETLAPGVGVAVAGVDVAIQGATGGKLNIWKILGGLLIGVPVGVIGIAAFLAIGLGMLMNPETAGNGECGSGSTIVIDPGHIAESDVKNNGDAVSGNWSNTGGEGIIIERHEVLNIAKSLQDKLTQKGYTVILTRTDPEGKISNKERIEKANAANAALFLSIHNDDPGSSGKVGYFFMYPDKTGNINNAGAVKGPSSDVQKSSKKAAQTLRDAVSGKLGPLKPTKNNGILAESQNGGNADNGGLLVKSVLAKVPITTVELGNVENATEANWVKNNTETIAEALATGISNFVPLADSSGGSCTNTYGQKVVDKAKELLGVSYVWAGCHSDPPAKTCSGPDCSGLVSWAWYWGSDKKVNLHGASTGGLCALRKNEDFKEISDIKNAQPGDILVWDYTRGCSGNIHHTGIYTGDMKYIHAPSTGDVVKISKFPRSDGQKALILRPIAE